MQTNSDYQSYLVAMQNYETTQGCKEYQASFANGFEAIYNKAKEQEIGFFNAKEFLQTLSQSELQTLQKYSGLTATVDVNTLSSEGAYTSEEAKLAVAAFWNAFNASFTGDKSSNEAEETNDAVAQFLKDLRTKGAAKFLSDLNKEKIEKLVEEYRAKLIETMGDSPEAMQEIEKMVKDFKKKLMEEMREKMEDEAKNKGKTIPISFNSVVQKLIDLAQKQTVQPLEKLLQS